MDLSTLKLHHFKDVLTVNPFDRSFYQTLLGRDRDEWLELRDKTLDHINSLLIEEEGVKYLPEGTLLYHGSLIYPFIVKKAALTFERSLGLIRRCSYQNKAATKTIPSKLIQPNPSIQIKLIKMQSVNKCEK